MSRRVSQDAVNSFVEEMRSAIAAMRQAIADLVASDGAVSDGETSNGNRRETAASELFRLAHSLKGTAALLGLAGTSEVAWQLEDYTEGQLEHCDTLAERHELLSCFCVLLERNADRIASGPPATDDPEAILSEVIDAVKLARRLRDLPEDGDDTVAEEALDRVAVAAADRAVQTCDDIPTDAGASAEAAVKTATARPDETATVDAADLEISDHESEISDFQSAGPNLESASASNFDVDLLDMDQLDAFIAEADDHLRCVALALNDYAKLPEDIGPLHEVRRRIHSLKGAAATSGFHDIAHLSHRLEDLLQRRISGELESSPDLTELAQSTVDALEELAQGLSGGEACLPLYERYDRLFGAAAVVPDSSRGTDADSVTGGTVAVDRRGNVDAASFAAGPVTVAGILEPYRPSSDQLLELEQDILGRRKISAELMEVFQEEAEDHLRSMYGCFTELEKDLTSRALLQSVRRSAHTLKGAAGAVGLKVVTQLAHRTEDLLDRLYEGGASLNRELLTLLYSTTDALQDLTHGDFQQATMHNTVAALYAEYAWRLASGDVVRVDSLDAIARANREAAERARAATAVVETAETATVAEAEVTAVATDEADAELEVVADDVFVLSDEVDMSGDVESSDIAAADNAASAADSPAVDVDENAAQDSEIVVDQPGFTVAPLKVGGSESSGQNVAASGDQKKGKRAARKAAREESQTGQVLRVPVQRLDALTRLVGELIINRTAFEQRMTDFAQFVEEMQLSIERLRSVAGQLESRYSVDLLGGRKMVAGDGASLAVLRSRLEEFDDLEFDRYTEFHLLAQSLAESSSDLNTVGGELRNLIGDFDQLLTRQGRLSRDTQDRLMRIRMVPLATLATRLHRTVRVVANQQGKQIDLEISGEYVELDKFVLEEMADPLLHLLRNAADHGIEHPSDRAAAGKSERGVVRVEAFYQGTQVVVQISDDGRGLDIDRIKAKAVELGMVTPQEAEELSTEAAFAFIFQAGFSTAKEISEVSGRGVGMDIVRDKVSSLKGTVSVESEPGQGTTFTVRLPMTLAVTRALLVSARQATFAIPMQAVVQILRIDREQIDRVGTQPIVRIGGRACPLVDLADRLSLRGMADESLSAVPVLIVDAGGKQIALSVEKILHGRDIVVKTLGNHLRSVDGLIGATLMGDGSVVPILDVAWLVGTTATAKSGSSAAATQKKTRRSAGDSCTVMVVDDSVSVRRVMTNLLRSQGWHVLEARDGVDALEVLQGASRQPDIFLLDIEMPRMDGYELLSSLRSHDAFRNTPVVMVTSRAGDKHRQKAMNLGATDYLIKPYQDEQLLNLVRRLVDEPQAVGAGT